MSHEQQSSGDQAAEEDWTRIQDPEERRRMQNRISQRRYRQRTRDEQENNERRMVNQEHAGSSYNPADPGDLERYPREYSGIPWGGVSVRYAAESGRVNEQNSQHSSREASVYTAGSGTGGGGH
ncbi:uncharacterized protein K452DRAFT_287347 [Aplosporella prunicola CBS 121167]|uniref:BZIP domain-containing protein n=1 Tax=Aplosporella prunicola CBS 121167 TaxID=1176127 RepID=A0A6A6BFH7_9PEZI|nr:uncharacterized protein K452DRAFT_287347 [Aplosporella prunicola CBS 121167]KAF2142133.1 hypothetical protein K452DRAFT_287347 [Aplosporella prunicola CBS 121167]